MAQPVKIVSRIRLRDFDPDDCGGVDKDETRDKTRKLCQRLGELQHLLYANATHAVILLLQGMDGSGKDSTGASVVVSGPGLLGDCVAVNGPGCFVRLSSATPDPLEQRAPMPSRSGIGCPTAAIGRTWGMIKQIYR